MPFTNYTELQAEIALRLAREDLTSVIPGFIAQVEAFANTSLRTLQMEQRATATLAEYVALPTDFLELRSVKLQGTPKTTLRLVTPEYMDEWLSSTSGVPKHFCLIANQLRFAPDADTGYTVEIDYFKTIPPLASNATNWLLTSYPSAYIFGAEFYAFTHLQDANGAASFSQAFTSEIDRIRASDKRARWEGAPMVVRPAGPVV